VQGEHGINIQKKSKIEQDVSSHATESLLNNLPSISLPAEYTRLGCIAMTDLIKAVTDEHSLVVFSSSRCPFCKQVIVGLIDAGLGKAAKVIEVTDVIKAHLLRKTGKRSVPSVWIGDKYIGGCNDGPESWMGCLPNLRNGKIQQWIKSLDEARELENFNSSKKRKRIEPTESEDQTDAAEQPLITALPESLRILSKKDLRQFKKWKGKKASGDFIEEEPQLNKRERARLKFEQQGKSKTAPQLGANKKMARNKVLEELDKSSIKSEKLMAKNKVKYDAFRPPSTKQKEDKKKKMSASKTKARAMKSVGRNGNSR
jgi:glutaredoxin